VGTAVIKLKRVAAGRGEGGGHQKGASQKNMRHHRIKQTIKSQPRESKKKFGAALGVADATPRGRNQGGPGQVPSVTDVANNYSEQMPRGGITSECPNSNPWHQGKNLENKTHQTIKVNVSCKPDVRTTLALR